MSSLWSRQPPTSSDRTNSLTYTTQPHVELDSILSALPYPPSASREGRGGEERRRGGVAVSASAVRTALTPPGSDRRATLSMGPVGISDGLGETDAALISQAFMSKTDSTLLRPSRPLSTVDVKDP